MIVVLFVLDSELGAAYPLQLELLALLLQMLKEWIDAYISQTEAVVLLLQAL